VWGREIETEKNKNKKKTTKQNSVKLSKATPADFSSTARVGRLLLSELGHP
jgi:hypothetical protein